MTDGQWGFGIGEGLVAGVWHYLPESRVADTTDYADERVMVVPAGVDRGPTACGRRMEGKSVAYPFQTLAEARREARAMHRALCEVCVRFVRGR